MTDFKNASGQGFPCSTSRCPGRRQWNGHGGWKQSKAWNEVEGTRRKSGYWLVSYFPAFDRHCMAYRVFQSLLEIIWTFSLKAYLLKASKFHIAWSQVRLLFRIFWIFFSLGPQMFRHKSMLPRCVKFRERNSLPFFMGVRIVWSWQKLIRKSISILLNEWYSLFSWEESVVLARPKQE